MSLSARELRRVAGVGVAALVLAVSQAPSASAAIGPVSQTPMSGTPFLDPNVGSQNIQQIAQCGSTMYAVGSFSSIRQGSQTFVRNNVFAFSASNGTMSSWNPNVNGWVQSVTFSPDCSTAYLGGSFTAIGGTTVKNIAAVSTSSGAVISSFAHNSAGKVLTLQYAKGQIIAGGQFDVINGASRSKMASLDPTTGAVTSLVNLSFSGTYPNSSVPTKVYNSQLSNSGSKLLIEGVFTNISGSSRQQVAVIDLGGSSAVVNGWYASEFNGACSPSGREAFYAKAAAWSPDDSVIYVASTGYKPPGSSSSAPRTGLCDSAAAFPASSSNVTHTWINYTGCDSLYAVAADSSTVYIAGHERWANNPNGCDFAGPGALSRPGIGGLSPATGLATSWNPTRSRGHGANDLLVTDAGLWVASDNGNDGSSQQCGGVAQHGGLCFLPY